MANDKKDLFDKLNEKLDVILKKMEIATLHSEQGYTPEEYDEDYENFFDSLSNMSNEELEKEKFLSEGILQTYKKDDNYNNIILTISIISLLIFMLIDTFDTVTTYVDIKESDKLLPYIIFSLGIIGINLIFLFVIISQMKRSFKYNHKKQQIRLKIKIINKVIKERENKKEDM